MRTRHFMEFEETQKALDGLCKIMDNLIPDTNSDDFSEVAYKLYDSIFNDMTVIDMKLGRLKYMLEAEGMLTVKEADKKFSSNYDTLKENQKEIEEISI